MPGPGLAPLFPWRSSMGLAVVAISSLLLFFTLVFFGSGWGASRLACSSRPCGLDPVPSFSGYGPEAVGRVALGNHRPSPLCGFFSAFAWFVYDPSYGVSRRFCAAHPHPCGGNAASPPINVLPDPVGVPVAQPYAGDVVLYSAERTVVKALPGRSRRWRWRDRASTEFLAVPVSRVRWAKGHSTSMKSNRRYSRSTLRRHPSDFRCRCGRLFL